MIAPAHGENLVGLARGERGEQRGLIGFGARVGEEHLGVFYAGQPGNLFGELDLAADQVQRRGVHDAAGDLPLDRVAHLGHVVAEHVREDAGEEVEVPAALGVGDPAALAADDLDRLVVVDTDPVGDDRAVAGEELRHGSQSSLFAATGGNRHSVMFLAGLLYM